jgi:2-octaprenyl-6-methoxyphenol hydroxylase
LHLAPTGPPDRRTSALMLPSVEYLQSAGLIGDPAAIGHPLTQIRIIDATSRLLRAPETLFDATEFGMQAFGWNFPNGRLSEAFEAARASLPNLTTRQEAVSRVGRRGGTWTLTLADGAEVDAQMLVGADGKHSLVRGAERFGVREHAFKQSALVADLELGRPLGGASVEFHYPHGPFTLVPAGGNRGNLVWIDGTDLLKAVQAAGPERLRQLLAEKAQRLFGDMRPTTPAAVFPL